MDSIDKAKISNTLTVFWAVMSILSVFGLFLFAVFNGKFELSIYNITPPELFLLCSISIFMWSLLVFFLNEFFIFALVSGEEHE